MLVSLLDFSHLQASVGNGKPVPDTKGFKPPGEADKLLRVVRRHSLDFMTTQPLCYEFEMSETICNVGLPPE